jgi:hypothetical protein
MLYAFLDDSQMRSGQIHVYAHALYVPQELPQIFLFTGNKEILWTKEDDITRYILENLPQDYVLVACTHYSKYPSLWDMPFVLSIEDLGDRSARKAFLVADIAARQAARHELERIVRQSDPFHLSKPIFQESK